MYTCLLCICVYENVKYISFLKKKFPQLSMEQAKGHHASAQHRRVYQSAAFKRTLQLSRTSTMFLFHCIVLGVDNPALYSHRISNQIIAKEYKRGLRM